MCNQTWYTFFWPLCSLSPSKDHFQRNDITAWRQLRKQSGHSFEPALFIFLDCFSWPRGSFRKGHIHTIWYLELLSCMTWIFFGNDHVFVDDGLSVIYTWAVIGAGSLSDRILYQLQSTQIIAQHYPGKEVIHLPQPCLFTVYTFSI